MNMDEPGSFVDVYRWLTQWRWCPWPTPIPSYPAEQSWRQETLQLKGGAHGKSWCSTPQISIVSFKSQWIEIYIMVYHGILYQKIYQSSIKLQAHRYFIDDIYESIRFPAAWWMIPHQPSSWRTGSLETNLWSQTNCRIVRFVGIIPVKILIAVHRDGSTPRAQRQVVSTKPVSIGDNRAPPALGLAQVIQRSTQIEQETYYPLVTNIATENNHL